MGLITKPTGGMNKAPSWMERANPANHQDGQEYIKALVMGRAGTGKTTFSSTFPKPVYLDFDKNMRVIPEENIRLRRIPFERGMDVDKELKEIITAIRNKTGPFAEDQPFGDIETLVIDSGHKFGAFLMEHIMISQRKNPKTDKPGYDGYQVLKVSWETLVEQLKDLPLNVVMTCGVKAYEDALSEKLELFPMIEGSYRDLVAHEFGEVYYFERKKLGSNVEYRCYTNVYETLDMLKTTANKAGKIPYMVKSPTYQKLYVDGNFEN